MFGVFERLVALLLLVLWAPVLAVLMLLIRLGSPGPAIYKQIRIGKGGKEFVIYKLRTMYTDAESGPVIRRDDPRITKLGRSLRQTRIDEVPQLWNIVLGEMVFVGPRPHNISGSKRLREQFGRRYTNRYAHKPGIHGMVQLLWSREEGFRRMVAFDELFRLRKSRSLSLIILLQSWRKIKKSNKTF